MPDEKRTAKLDWEDVRYFASLVRHRTLAATARALNVNHATVSRRLESLEISLGQPLFDRSSDGYTLTAAGKEVFDKARSMEEAAATLSRRLESGTAISGLVRITAARILADGFMVERLGGLVSEYPELDFEILAESRNLSLARRETDLALRLGRPTNGELLTRRIAVLRYALYASPAYLARIEAGETPVFIGFDQDSEVPEAAWAKRAFSGHRLVLCSNSQTSQAAAARGGYGVALLPNLIAESMPDLVRVDLFEQPPDRELWLVMRPDVAKVPKIRVVADYLVEMFGNQER
jgi:DNA-binding transcriptional LysR family regulator